MPDILIRGVDAQCVKKLKARAKQNGRSLQSEAKLTLEKSVRKLSRDELQVLFEHWDKEFAGRTFSNSADLIREDRDR